jgi:DNA-binding transcriptional LysR family regulator
LKGCDSKGTGLDSWDEVRTAWQVARLGTVSGAAEVLGVHHATVIRHIDALERRLGAKLFQRHSRGYTPTEAGRDLLKVAEIAADQFGQLAGRIRGQGEDVAGDLVVTSITGMSPLLVPVLAGFQARHPQVTVRFLTDSRLFRLEYGEAHVAIRAGTVPEDPDNVVQAFGGIQAGLFAARSYAEANGLPQGPDGFARHRFVGTEGDHARAPFHRWMTQHVPQELVAFRATEAAALTAAIRAGVGIGFVALHEAMSCPDLVQVMPSRTEWEAPLWLVTHVDLHRTPKVQAFLTHLKAEARHWTGAGPSVGTVG